VTCDNSAITENDKKQYNRDDDNSLALAPDGSYDMSQKITLGFGLKQARWWYKRMTRRQYNDNMVMRTDNNRVTTAAKSTCTITRTSMFVLEFTGTAGSWWVGGSKSGPNTMGIQATTTSYLSVGRTTNISNLNLINNNWCLVSLPCSSQYSDKWDTAFEICQARVLPTQAAFEYIDIPINTLLTHIYTIVVLYNQSICLLLRI
jgi:hypothetical protein